MASDSILDEAKRLVYGDRGAAYGHPYHDWTRTAAMWTAILGVPVTARQAILCMIAVKLSRECNRHGRDNLTDVAGYADCAQRVAEMEARAACVHAALCQKFGLLLKETDDA